MSGVILSQGGDGIRIWRDGKSILIPTEPLDVSPRIVLDSGRLVASAGSIANVFTLTGRPLYRLSGHQSYISSIDIAMLDATWPWGAARRQWERNAREAAQALGHSRVFTASFDGTCRLWKLPAGVAAVPMPHKKEAVVSLTAANVFRGDSAVGCVCAVDNGNFCAAGAHDGTLRLFDSESGAQVSVHEAHLEGEVQQVLCLGQNVADAQGPVLLTAGMSMLRLWDSRAGGGHVGDMHVGRGWISKVIRATTNELVCGSTDGEILLFDVRHRRRPVAKFCFHQGALIDLAVQGRTLASASRGSPSGKPGVVLWNLDEGIGSPLRGSDTGVLSLAFDEAMLVTASGDNAVRVFDLGADPSAARSAHPKLIRSR